ncbi:hypothetical protein LINPERHAP1_LOCUS24303 [Linum perenne]
MFFAIGYAFHSRMYSGGCCLWCQVYDSGMARFQDEAKGILPRRVSVQHDKARSSAYTWSKVLHNAPNLILDIDNGLSS